MIGGILAILALIFLAVSQGVSSNEPAATDPNINTYRWAAGVFGALGYLILIVMAGLSIGAKMPL